MHDALFPPTVLLLERFEAWHHAEVFLHFTSFQAFYELLLLWGAAAATAVAFHGINPLAGYLLLPYQAWLTLASMLNYRVWQDNKEKDE